MVSLVICCLTAIKRWIPHAPLHTHRGAFPLTPVDHITVTDEDLQRFKSIFIIGDVHGCYDELQNLMKKAGVQSDDILKIFTGDLVNKGPKSQEVVDLLRNSPSMMSVRGNHDELGLEEYFSDRPKEGNEWMKNLTKEAIDYLTNLPYTITVEPLNSVIVHAGLVPGLPLDMNTPYNLVHMRNVVITDYFWEEGIQPCKDYSKGDPWASMWGGPQHVYFGHDARRGLQEYPFATGLDTGCCYGKSLTGIFISGPRKGEYVSVEALDVHRKPKIKKSTKQ